MARKAKVEAAEAKSEEVKTTGDLPDVVDIPAVTPEVFQPVLTPIVDGKAAIYMSDPGWTAYILSHLDPEKEMVEGKPTCDGLRRVFALLFDVRRAAATVIQAPETENQNRATVQYSLTYHSYLDPRTEYFIQDAVDICLGNTNPIYARHAVATASTTAESRCYKKALKLVRVLTADEMQAPDESEVRIAEIQESSREIASSQKQIITGLCSKLKIDLVAFIRKTINKEVPNVQHLTYGDAQKLIPVLASYNSGPDSKSGAVIPDDILIK